MPAWHSKQTMLEVRVGDTCSASTDGWTIATNSIGYLRRGAASHANPHAHAHARCQAQRVARTRFTSLRGTQAQRRAKARARCTAHADPRAAGRAHFAIFDTRRTDVASTAAPSRKCDTSPPWLQRAARNNLQQHARWHIQRNACNQPSDSTLIPVDINSRADPASASHTCVVVQLHAAWALHHAACAASEALIRAQTRRPSLRTPALTSHSRVQHCIIIIITPVVVATPRAATCKIQDATCCSERTRHVVASACTPFLERRKHRDRHRHLYPRGLVRGLYPRGLGARRRQRRLSGTGPLLPALTGGGLPVLRSLRHCHRVYFV
jgi:hypothetical protein